jgi:hypothetical protein
MELLFSERAFAVAVWRPELIINSCRKDSQQKVIRLGTAICIFRDVMSPRCQLCQAEKWLLIFLSILKQWPVGYIVRVNSKKPPHLRRKFAKQLVFGEIAKNHRFCTNLFQCALIVELRRINTISDNRGSTVSANVVCRFHKKDLYISNLSIP